MDDTDALLARLASTFETSPALKKRSTSGSVLTPDDEAYLTSLIGDVMSGGRAVLFVEKPNGGQIRYMLSNATRAESVMLMGKVLEGLGQRMADGDN